MMPKKIKYFIALLSFFSLGACQSGVHKSSILQKYQYIPISAETHYSKQLEKFDLASLKSHVAAASPAIKKAQANLRAIKFTTAIAESEKYPAFSATGEALAGNNVDNTFEIAITQLIYSFGKLDAKIAKTMVQEEVAKAELEESKRATTVQLVDYYFDWWLTSEIFAIRQQALRDSRAVLRNISEQSKSGILPLSDLTSAELQQDKLERAFLEAENDLERALADLSFFVKSDLTDEELRTALPVDRKISDISNAHIREIITNSPGLRMQRAKIATLIADVEVVKLSSWPTINAVAKKTWEDFTNTNSSRETREGIGIELQFSLSQKGLISSQLGEIREKIKAAQAEHEALERELETTLRKQQRSIRSSERRISILTKSLERSEAALASNKRKFKSGSDGWHSYLSSISELAEIKLALQEAKLLGAAAFARFEAQLNG